MVSGETRPEQTTTGKFRSLHCCHLCISVCRFPLASPSRALDRRSSLTAFLCVSSQNARQIRKLKHTIKQLNGEGKNGSLCESHSVLHAGRSSGMAATANRTIKGKGEHKKEKSELADNVMGETI